MSIFTTRISKKSGITANQTASLGGRDLVMDFLRVICIFAVVAAHLLMIGISLQDGIAIINPLTDLSWFAQGTWWGQIMPLFFIIGGFAALTSWRSGQNRGEDANEYFRKRLVRLARPAVALFAFLTLSLWIARVAGVPEDLLRQIALGSGVQLWFLAAYLICQLLVPVLAWLHTRAPWQTGLGMFGAAVLVDVVRFSTGEETWGLFNMVFVWMLLTQIGFVYADGGFDRLTRGQLLLGAMGCYGVLALLTQVTVGPYPIDMLSSQNPPLMPLIFVGIAQILLVKACYPALQRITQRPSTLKIMYLVGGRAMTIYLWHLPLMIGFFGLCLLLGVPFSEPGSAAWWLSRMVFYLAIFGFTLLVTAPLTRLETAPVSMPSGVKSPGTILVIIAILLAASGPLMVMRVGLNPENALWGLVTLALSLVLVDGAGQWMYRHSILGYRWKHNTGKL